MALESKSVDSGTGIDVAADALAGGEVVQYFKMIDGVANSETPINAGAGVKANALRVVIASDNGDITIADGGNSITVDGTVTANLSATDNAVLDAIQAAVQIIDNAISGNEMQVDVLTMPTVTIQDGGNTITIDGTVTANLGATDNAVLDAIQAASEACQTALEGTLTISGTVTANLGATDNAVLDNIDSNTDYGAQVGGGTEAAALRVTLANNSTGVISVDDNGGALTVDGEVTANLGATDNAVLDTIATNTGAALTDTELRATPVPVSGTLTGITGDVSIDDGGNTITVDGTVTANLGATDNAVLDVISTHVNWLNEYSQAGDASTQMRVDVIGALPAGTNAIGKLAANDGVDIGDVGLDSGEEHIGQVGMEDDVITVTLSVDTSAYADGDVLSDTQEIASAVRNNGETCILQSITVLDKADQGEDFEIIFLDANTSLGTENSAPDITDSEAEDVIGHFSFSNDYVDLGACQIRHESGIGMTLKAGASSTSIYFATLSKGTGTYAASDIIIKFGFLRN